MPAEIAPGDGDVLLVVDLQNDFCSGGSLPVPDADAIPPLVSRIARRFPHVVLAQDWHPPGHQSFASAHPGRRPFESIETSYGAQILWPDHCVQATRGAEWHRDLDVPHAALVLRKGSRPLIDSYSAFFENDRRTPTGLAGYLRERGLGRIFLAGLAFDFCVRYSAEDAQRLGFRVVVVEDACRSLDVEGSADATRKDLAGLGIPCIGSPAFDRRG